MASAPPRTRGSPPGDGSGFPTGRGSPAHAGIAPRGWRCASRWRWLPRARGDRPFAILPCSSSQMAPPRTRGSPPGLPDATDAPHGSPAHAGIAPTSSSTSTEARGLPRARGDRPALIFAGVVGLAAPPRTRGSPSLTLQRLAGGVGSPAHAGIAPSASCRRRRWCRLPRARGDRPVWPSGPGANFAAPPRTRGSPRLGQPALHRPPGSPAHAGIAPSASTSAPATSGLPRARGDRPGTAGGNVWGLAAPPRTRGSPLRVEHRALRHGGSPAHAGIAPAPASRRPPPHWLPRARGDRPATSALPPQKSRAPPRTRGSPPADAGGAADAGGSPAHAGIAPRVWLVPTATERLPRARGDRPVEVIVRPFARYVGAGLEPVHVGGPGLVHGRRVGRAGSTGPRRGGRLRWRTRRAPPATVASAIASEGSRRSPPRLDPPGARAPVGPPEDRRLAGPRQGQSRERSRPRARVCLLKDCGRRFQTLWPQQRYCGRGCQVAAKRWRTWKAQQRYRRSEGGRQVRRGQSKRYRRRVAGRKREGAPSGRPEAAARVIAQGEMSGLVRPARLLRGVRPDAAVALAAFLHADVQGRAVARARAGATVARAPMGAATAPVSAGCTRLSGTYCRQPTRARSVRSPQGRRGAVEVA